MKIAQIQIECCRECPFCDIDNSVGYCTHLENDVDLMEIDKDCPLEDLE